MPIRRSAPLNWRPKGLTDSRDGTNSFSGAMKRLINMIPDPSTQGLWVCRPAAQRLTDFTGANAPPDPGLIAGFVVIGELAFGLAESSLTPGFDEPFVYDFQTSAFLPVAGITSANVPHNAVGGAASKLLQVAGRVLVIAPGFRLPNAFGWFDISGAMLGTTGDTVSGTRYISGNPNLLGVQPGMLVTGTGIPAGTTVVNTHPYFIGFDFVGDTHGTVVLDGIADTTDLNPFLQITGPGIQPGTTIAERLANSIVLSQAALTSAAGATFEVFGRSFPHGSGFPGGFDALGSTHSNTVIDNIYWVNAAGLPLGFAVGQGISGDGILPNTVVTSVGPASQITISNAATSTIAAGRLFVEGATIVLSQNATATNDEVTFTIAGGTRAAPLWGAGNTDNFPLPSVPLDVAQMNGRAWFALGLNGIVYSDSGLPCRVSNTLAVQALTTNDGLAVTAIGQQQLGVPLTGGIVQALVAFEGVSKLQQITGDQATGNLAMNVLPEATGTLSKLSVVPVGGGRLAFVSPLGLRFVGLDGSISQPIGADGQGVTQPFQYAQIPSRTRCAYNVGVLRITVFTHNRPFEEYWYDIPRGIWSGPHTFPARLIQPWESSFIMAPIGIPASLWASDAFQTHLSSYTENGYPLSFFMETVLLPDNASMAMNAVVEGGLMCAASSAEPIQVTAFDEIGGLLGVAEPIAPAIGNEAVRQRSTNWDVPLIFKQMTVRMTGASGASVRVGNLYQRYEVLGYNLDEATAGNFWLLSSRRPYPILLADDGTTGLIPG